MKEKLPEHILFPEEEGGSIARRIKALREHTEDIASSEYPVTPGSVPHDEKKKSYEKIKAEGYALIAYILEQVHPEAEKLFEEQGDKIKIYRNHNFPPDVDNAEYLERETLFEDTRNFFWQTRKLEGAYFSAFVDAMYAWSKKTTEDGESYDAKVYARLKGLLESQEIGVFSTFAGRIWSVREPDTAEHFVLRGANTASVISWQILEAIPIAFYQKYGRVIMPEEFSMIARDAEPLVLTLSSLHLKTFSQIEEFSRAGSSIHRALMLELPLEFFEIKESPGEKPMLVFNREALKDYENYCRDRNYTLSEESRFGCPARDARVVDEGGEAQERSIISLCYAPKACRTLSCAKASRFHRRRA